MTNEALNVFITGQTNGPLAVYVVPNYENWDVLSNFFAHGFGWGCAVWGCVFAIGMVMKALKPRGMGD